MQIQNKKTTISIGAIGAIIVMIGITSVTFIVNEEISVETQQIKQVQTVSAASHLYPLDYLAKETKYAIVGTVKEITPLISQYDEKTKMVFSDVTIHVEKDLNGDYKEKEIIVRIQGGEKDGYITTTDFNATFEIDERVLIFVPEKEPHTIWGNNYYVAGLFQGKYSLSDGKAVGSHYNEGISEDELFSKIQIYRGNA